MIKLLLNFKIGINLWVLLKLMDSDVNYPYCYVLYEMIRIEKVKTDLEIVCIMV